MKNMEGSATPLAHHKPPPQRRQIGPPTVMVRDHGEAGKPAFRGFTLINRGHFG